ncbi:DMT family transporter [Agaribacter marinus]|uniref:Multidrug DMT transporter permease n=1 Tax=Agaribacter marinus TaxID=1431249 RepID=A0AA37T0R5_9ALTE|nr:DMT family transporter [Agaribacter marinus]GLR71546.1 multidrug DMT transporter permease [Agaribacter marinus]
MRAKDFAELILLGAIWGASFMLMRAAVPEFGVFALVEVRAIGAALCLLPLVWLKKQGRDLFANWRHLFVVGLLNTAVPFSLYNYALGHIDSSLGAILNATAPMFGILVAWLYLRDHIGRWSVLGMLVGFTGVVVISFDQKTSESASLLPVFAALGAAICYAIAASYMKKHLSHAKPFAVAAGSQILAAAMLLPFAMWYLPTEMPSYNAWIAASILSIVCTGLAYVMYFDLIAKVGTSSAISVGYLIPMFGIFWGVLILDESLSFKQLFGAGLILLGVVLATNAIQLLRRKKVGAEMI